MVYIIMHLILQHDLLIKFSLQNLYRPLAISQGIVAVEVAGDLSMVVELEEVLIMEEAMVMVEEVGDTAWKIVPTS